MAAKRYQITKCFAHIQIAQSQRRWCPPKACEGPKVIDTHAHDVGLGYEP